MKYLQMVALFLVVSAFSFCGGDGTKRTTSSDTDPSITLSTLSVINANPVNGDGLIQVSAVSADAIHPSGGDQLIHITGTSGDTNEIHHQFEIHYYIFFVGSETRAKITSITHTWATTLANTIDGGISVCDAACGETVINPSLKTMVFANQVLDKTANLSTLVGTVVYP